MHATRQPQPRTIAPRRLLPAGHDPSSRRLVHVAGDWELRVGDDRVLQAWAPRSQVSVVRLPAPLSTRRASNDNGWLFLVSSEAFIRALLFEDFGLVLPSIARLDAVERWFLGRREASALCEIAAYGPELGSSSA